MLTRKQYLNKECSFDEYYGQFLTPGIIRHVEHYIGRDAIMESTDPHLNDIPLERWDRVFLKCPATVNHAMREGGDYPTLGGLVCLAKTAARRIKNGINA